MDKLQELQLAKDNVIWIIEHGNEALVDMHGLVYWASVVEKLREEIRSA